MCNIHIHTIVFKLSRSAKEERKKEKRKKKEYDVTRSSRMFEYSYGTDVIYTIVIMHITSFMFVRIYM